MLRANAEERLLGQIRYRLLEASRLAEVRLRVEEMVGEGLGVFLRALANETLARLQLPPGLLQT